MNRTKIEWTDYSWNPIVGCRGRTGEPCWYCYAKRGARRNYFMHLALYEKGKRKNPPCKLCRDFIPHFHPERLKQPWEVKKPRKVFVCSIADLFAPWTSPHRRKAVLSSIFRCPIKHTFQLLTKHPERIPNIKFPDNVWIGTTVTGENHDEVNIDAIRDINTKVRFVSFEPLLGYIDFPNHDLEGIDWVIIGKLTGSKRVKLKNDWVIEIREECRFWDIPRFEKNNLGLKNPVQQFPNEYKKGGVYR